MFKKGLSSEQGPGGLGQGGRGSSGTRDPLKLRIYHQPLSMRVSEPDGTLLSARSQGLTMTALQLLTRKFPFNTCPLPPSKPPTA